MYFCWLPRSPQKLPWIKLTSLRAFLCYAGYMFSPSLTFDTFLFLGAKSYWLFFSLLYLSHPSDSFHFHIKLLVSCLPYCSGLLTCLYEIHSCHIHFPKHNSSEARLKKLWSGEKVGKDNPEKLSQDEFRWYLVVQVTPFLENKISLLGRESSILIPDPSSSF